MIETTGSGLLWIVGSETGSVTICDLAMRDETVSTNRRRNLIVGIPQRANGSNVAPPCEALQSKIAHYLEPNKI